VKRLVVLLLGLAACSSAAQRPTTAGDQTVGADSPRLAVQAFLGAAKAQDLRAMALVWGTKNGPARDVVDHSQLEKRELIMQCYVTHDTFNILSDAPGQDGTRVLAVMLRSGQVARQTTFTAVQGPSDRWYVRDLKLEPLKDLCATS
jgi:hypothetical protein